MGWLERCGNMENQDLRFLPVGLGRRGSNLQIASSQGLLDRLLSRQLCLAFLLRLANCHLNSILLLILFSIVKGLAQERNLRLLKSEDRT